MTTPPSNKQLAATLLDIVKDNHASLLSDEREAMRIAAQRLQEISNSPLTANSFPSTPLSSTKAKTTMEATFAGPQPPPLTAKEAEEALRGPTTTEADSYKFPVGSEFFVADGKYGGGRVGEKFTYATALLQARQCSTDGKPAYVLACLHKVTCVPNPTYKVEAP